MKDRKYYAEEFIDIYEKQTGLKWDTNNFMQVKGDPNNPFNNFNPLIVIGSVKTPTPEGIEFVGYTMIVEKGGYKFSESSKWIQDSDGRVNGVFDTTK
jgi:hypothetical protein